MKKTLSEIFEIGSGGTPSKSHPEFYGGNIPWIKTGDLKSEYLYEAESFITDEGLKNSSAKMYETDTVLIAMYGATIGATSILKFPACTNQACAAFKRSEEILPEYLYYFLRSQKDKFVSDGVGGAQPNISAGYLKKVKIIVKPLEEQESIICILDKLNHLLEVRENQLKELDTIIKARFVELFGNPKTNEKGFTKAPMGEYMTLLTDFSSNGSYKTLDSGVTMYDEPNYAWMVRTTDLESGDMSSIKYIDEKAYELLSKSKIYGGEIIMNKIGSAGKVYLMPEIDMPASLGRNAFMFRYDDRINVRFLYEQLVSEYGQAEIQQYVRGAVTKTITKDDARSVLIIVPEKELQDEYAEFVKQVDKSKFNL